MGLYSGKLAESNEGEKITPAHSWALEIQNAQVTRTTVKLPETEIPNDTTPEAFLRQVLVNLPVINTHDQVLETEVYTKDNAAFFIYKNKRITCLVRNDQDRRIATGTIGPATP